MKLDRETLVNEVDGHEERLKGPLWSKDGGEQDDSWMASLRNDPPASSEPPSPAPTYDRPPRPSPPPRAPTSSRPPRPSPPPRASSPDVSTEQILPRLDALDHAVEKLTLAVSRRPLGSGRPSWLAGRGSRGPARLLGAGRRTDGRMRPSPTDDLRSAPTHPAPDATKDDCGGVGVPLAAGPRGGGAAADSIADRARVVTQRIAPALAAMRSLAASAPGSIACGRIHGTLPYKRRL